MKVRSIQREDIPVLFLLPGRERPDLTPYLEDWLEKGISRLEWCFVVEEGQELLGRILYGSYDGELEILEMSCRIFNEAMKEKLLGETLAQMKAYGFRRIHCHLYSDKPEYAAYFTCLLESGFRLIQEKKSFVWEKEAPLPTAAQRQSLTYKTLAEVGTAAYVDAIQAVTVGTLDQEEQETVGRLGAEQAAGHYFTQLKEIDYREDWWKLAYDQGRELIGLIIPQAFSEDIGAINYIGVVPEQRGKGYGQLLLAEGTGLLAEAGIVKVIADIDVHNQPMEQLLTRQGYRMDTELWVFLYEGEIGHGKD